VHEARTFSDGLADDDCDFLIDRNGRDDVPALRKTLMEKGLKICRMN
jgi:hypothetical protein